MRKPFFVKSRNSWYVWLNGKQEKLGTDISEEDAYTKYEELKRTSGSIRASTPVCLLMDRFLQFVKERKGERTLEWYQGHIQPFIDFIGKRLTVGHLRPHHVTDWVAKDHKGDSHNTIHGAIRAVQRPFNWAVKQGYLTRSPISSVEKPTPTPREAFISPDQWNKMMTLVTDDAERDFLTALRETGCRVQEIRRVEARHLVGSTWIFPTSEAKGKRRPRIIYLTDAALEIAKRRGKKFPTGPIFRNRKGTPWTRNAIKCRFRKFKQLGIKNLCATVIRHVYTTEALQNGVNPIALAELLGHSDITTLSRNYAHLFKSPQFLREQAEKALGKAPAPKS